MIFSLSLSYSMRNNSFCKENKETRRFLGGGLLWRGGYHLKMYDFLFYFPFVVCRKLFGGYVRMCLRIKKKIVNCVNSTMG